MRAAVTLSLGLCFAVAIGNVHAQKGGVPSCYAANQMTGSVPQPTRTLVMMIDETTLFNKSLRASAWDAVTPLLAPGTMLTVMHFSAFSQSRYTSINFSGLIEEGVPDSTRHAISMKKLRTFDECLKGQQGFVRDKLQAAMMEAFSKSSADLAKSDVIAAMSDASVAMRASGAKEKILFVMSDMLENSSVTSFYEAKGVRKIDPGAEIAKVDKAALFGDFGGARVWVMGAGLVSEEGQSKGVYRDPIRLKALQNFWAIYFKRSQASLVEFGTPELKQPIR